MGERDLPGPCGAAQRPADHRDVTRGVMRCAERWHPCDGGAGAVQRIADGGDLEHLGVRQRWQQTGQALRQHGLADARWPGHEQMVSACGSNLERPAGQRLAHDIGEFREDPSSDLHRGGHFGGPSLTTDHGNCLAQSRDRHDADAGDTGDLAGGGRSGEDAVHRFAARHPERHRHRTGDRPYRPVQTELPDEHRAVHLPVGDGAAACQHGHGNGEVEPGTPLMLERRRQAHRDAAGRPLESAVHHGRPDPVARLVDRSVGKSDDGHAGEAVGQVHLHLDHLTRHSDADGTTGLGHCHHSAPRM